MNTNGSDGVMDGNAQSMSGGQRMPGELILAQADDIDISNVSSSLLQSEWDRLQNL